MNDQKRRIVKWSRFIGKWSLSRLTRWAFLLMIGYWLFNNWHSDLPLDQLTTRYTFPDSKWVDVGGQAIHYRETGPAKAPPIVLLHDEGSSLHTWAQWTDTLSRKYRVISVDLPGFGLSGPNPRGSYSTFMYAGFLEQFADSLRLNKFSLAGVGLGGQVAWFFAADHPERLEKLVLLGAPGFEEPQQTIVGILSRTPIVNGAAWKITPRSWWEASLKQLYGDDRLVTDSLVNKHMDLFLRPGNRKAFTDRQSVRDNRPPIDFVERITLPTLILWGAEDALISPQHAYDFHRRIRGALLKIYQNTGHWPQEEMAGESAHDVWAFMEGKF